MYIYYIIAAVVIVLSMAVLKAYSKPVPVPVRVRSKGMSDTAIEGLIERLEDIIADLDSARE